MAPARKRPSQDSQRVGLSTALFIAVVMTAGRGEAQPIFDVTETPTSGALHWVLADVDDDGDPDVVLSQSTELRVYRNEGGVLELGPSIPIPIGLGPIVTDDFNGDARPDFAVVGYLGSLAFVISNGGTYDVNPLGTSNAVAAMDTGDFDNDGDVDLAVFGIDFSSQNRQVDFWLNQGAGTFVFGSSTVVPGGEATGLAALDFDADGTIDIVTTNTDVTSITLPPPIPPAAATGGAVSFFSNLGGGNLTPVGSIGGPFGSVTLADVDLDGVTDLVMTTAPDGATPCAPVVGISLGTAPSFGPFVALPLGCAPDSTAVYDLGGDAFPDLVFSDKTTGVITFAAGDGAGTFTNVTELALPDASRPLVGDLDLDGIPEVLLLYNPNDFTLSPSILVLRRQGTLNPFRRGDANGDGLFDISDAVSTLAALFIPTSPPILCEDAFDTNDDGTVDVSDAVFALAALFVPGAAPLPDPVDCGDDPTSDALDCEILVCP
ncbi:MAG: VCBS repeat-containing protein [Planctomycetes bacterium]|nr:VCBS repeat-containing protein [Planctomycetota bacterium]